MIGKLAIYLQYPFVRYALIVGILIALCSSLLGVTLVLKRFSYIGDGLSHVAFGAMAIAAVVGLTDEMLIVLPVTVVSAILLLRTGQNAKIKGAIGRRACGRISDHEHFLDIGQSVGRCMQHPVRVGIHSDADNMGRLAVRDTVCRGYRDLCTVLQQDICGYV